MALQNVIRYYGELSTPSDIRRRRKWSMETMRRMGAPTIVKHMYNDQDVRKGIALASPSLDSVYKQARHDDPLSFGVGYVSVELSDDEWYNINTGEVVVADADPGADWQRAPKYRGFGPGYLTYIIEPDVAEDAFKLDPTGALIKVQSATAQAPWYPEINDNDLLVNAVVDRTERVLQTNERYRAKMSNPISMRGHDRHGRREYTEDGGNRHVINQQFEMALVPETDIIYDVNLDR